MRILFNLQRLCFLLIFPLFLTSCISTFSAGVIEGMEERRTARATLSCMEKYDDAEFCIRLHETTIKNRDLERRAEEMERKEQELEDKEREMERQAARLERKDTKRMQKNGWRMAF